MLSELTVLEIIECGPRTRLGAGSGLFFLRINAPGWEKSAPGQFVMLRASIDQAEYLCARPFSICRLTDDYLGIFFQARGRATRDFAALKAGDRVCVWGPLGNFLPLDARVPTLILAGGIGIAPFVNYVDKHPDPEKITLEFGHRLPLGCYPFAELRPGCRASAHLEKNGRDREAFSALVKARIREFASSGIVLACGPTPFLRLVREFALKYKAETWLSLETRMACGIGACLGCAVKALLPPDVFIPSPAALAGPLQPEDTERFVQTCICGPNFRADRVLL
ncbi:MAG: dihydroorotate dehydrogenase electron transfer subunit [Desulfovibrio sp.]|nr:dihydroorotate dehydrogenase electron transfer subunit [Desulfovibrio sp.]